MGDGYGDFETEIHEVNTSKIEVKDARGEKADLIQVEELKSKIEKDKVEEKVIQFEGLLGKYAKQNSENKLKVKVVDGPAGKGEIVYGEFLLNMPNSSEIKAVENLEEAKPDIDKLASIGITYGDFVTNASSSAVLQESIGNTIDSGEGSVLEKDLEEKTGITNDESGQTLNLLNEGISSAFLEERDENEKKLRSLENATDVEVSYVETAEKELGSALKEKSEEYLREGKSVDDEFLATAGEEMKKLEIHRYVAEAENIRIEEDEKKKGSEKINLADNYRELVQKIYLAKEKYVNKDVENVVDSLDKQIDKPMDPECRLSIGVPAYREGKGVKNLLESSVAGQVDAKGESIDQKKVEYIVFLNCDQDSEIDTDTEQGIRDFIEEHSDINIHLVKSKLEYPREKSGERKGKLNRKMGLVYKVLGDLIVKRNMERDVDQATKANHIMKTGGVDARGRSERYVDNTINALSNSEVVQCKSVAELPRFVNEKFPSLTFAAHMEDRLNQTYNDSIVGLGVYRSWLYTEAGGFDKNATKAEEVDLSARIRKVINRSKGIYGLGVNSHIKELRVGTVNATDNPDRFLFAHSLDKPAASRYESFDSADKEFRSFDADKYAEGHEENKDDFETRVNRDMRLLYRKYIGRYVGGDGRNDIQRIELPNTPINESEAVNHFIGQLENRMTVGFQKMNQLVEEYNQKDGIKYKIETENIPQRVDTFLDMNVDDLCTKIEEVFLNANDAAEAVNKMRRVQSVLGANSVRDLINSVDEKNTTMAWKVINFFGVDSSYEIRGFLFSTYAEMCGINLKAKENI